MFSGVLRKNLDFEKRIGLKGVDTLSLSSLFLNRTRVPDESCINEITANLGVLKENWEEGFLFLSFSNFIVEYRMKIRSSRFSGKIAAIIESCSRKRACVIYVRVNIGLSPFSSRVPEVEHGQDSSESCQPAAVHGRRNFLTPRPDTDYIRRSRRQPIKNEYKRKLPVRHNLLNFIFVSRMIFAFENDR